MSNEHKIYALVFDRDTADFAVLNRFMKESELVRAWWHHLQNCYLIKSHHSASEISNALPRDMRDNGFLVVEVDLRHHDGWLSDKAWEWINKQTVSA
jgi:hypothetical protein